MSKVYLLQNQHKQLLGKNSEWLDGCNPAALFRTVHKDEAINQQFEAGSKDYSLRIGLLMCDVNAKKHPVIEPDDLPEVIAEAESDLQETEQSDTSEAEPKRLFS